MSNSDLSEPLPQKNIPISVGMQETLTADRYAVKNRIPVKRILYLSALSVMNALIIGIIAKGLVMLISLITHISFFGNFSSHEVFLGDFEFKWTVIFIPIIGGLIVGIMARYGSKAIRGHGIPEAMEQILTNKSKIAPRITLLKPLSAAVSIGTGGPFGAEGPIIATGGALGSFFGQISKVTANERKILLAAGATAGMAAIFGSPFAAILLAIELLLFEFSPRSIIPVALACVAGAGMHIVLFGSEPIFHMPPVEVPTYTALINYVIIGALVGVLAALLTRVVYAIEDGFEKLPIHWMWWPALGGIAVGVIGFIAPSTFSVGYQNITTVLSGHASLQVLFVLCFLKFLSWAICLGSGTSGGTLAPMLTIGGAIGALIGTAYLKFFPGSEINIATAALVGMAAMFAGASRAMLTSVIFALETTMQPHTILPLLGGCAAAYFISFFLMKNTIMTEKIARRGIKTPDSYAPDVLDTVTVEQIMKERIQLIDIDNTIGEVQEWFKSIKPEDIQNETSFTVVDDQHHVVGKVHSTDFMNENLNPSDSISTIMNKRVPTIYSDNTLRVGVDMMDRLNLRLLPVVSRTEKQKVVGSISSKDIFKALRSQSEDLEEMKRSISLKRRSFEVISKGRKFLHIRGKHG